jgi:tripartite-type tricarboxylate transporter receptor subunit TctC
VFVRSEGTEWKTVGRVGTFSHDLAGIRLQRRLARIARSDEFSVPLRKLVGTMAGVALIAGMLAIARAQADEVLDFYNGKQINLVVGYGAGGGYDVYARLIARYLGKYIPGNPNVIVQNMPGAGSLRSVNYLYNAAPKDGTVIGTFARDMPLLGIIGNANARFDPTKFTWLGSSSSYDNDAYLLFARLDAPVKSIADARRHNGPPLVLGGTGEGASGNDVSTVLRDALGLNLKVVVGYPDSNALFLAVDRKEVDGRCVGLSSVQSSHPQWLQPGSGMHALLQFARRTRHPDFTEVPTARELANNETSRALIELAEIPYTLSRPFAAPPDVPVDRAKALQAAFLAAHRDTQFLGEAARLKIDISPIGTKEVLRAIAQIAAASPELLGYMKKLLIEK